MLRARVGRLIPVALALAVPAVSFIPASAQETAGNGQKLRVFLDCRRCDFDHFRREIVFVDYMRDRTEAQLHVLVTTQQTGGGGTEFTFYFIGQDEFDGRQDTLRWTSTQDNTDDEVRTGMTRTFQLGLIPFAARTGMAPDLGIVYRGEQAGEAAPEVTPQDDPWNLWVFRTRLGGSVEGESRQSSVSLDGSLSANRTTEDLKLEFSASARYEEDQFELSSGEELLSVTRNYNTQATVVWSLSSHWSAGFRATLTRSTRSNQHLTLRGSPAIEYNIYPYSESTRRQITIMYTLGPVHYDYDEITLFDRTEETRIEENLDIAASFRQPWGNMNFSVEGSNFMHDFGLHRLELSGGFDVRLFRGFSFDVRGNVARIKDQIYVPREDIPDEDILLRRRELGTDFEYDVNIGLSYTFGSPFNNVVNTRLWRGGGGPGGGFGGGFGGGRGR